MATLEEIQKQIDKIREQTETITSEAQTIFEERGKQTIGRNIEKTPEETRNIISTDNIQDVTFPKSPSTETKEPDITGAKSRQEFFRTKAEQERQDAELIRKEKEAKEAEQEEAPKSWFDWLKQQGKKTISAFRGEQFEEMGIEPEKFFEKQEATIAEIGSLMTEYDKLVAQKEQAIDRVQNQTGADIGFLNRETREVENSYNIRLSQMSSGIKTKMAIMEMKQGNFNQARDFVREAVSDYTYELQIDYATFQQFREENKDAIKQLDTEYQQALDKAEQAKLSELELVETEKNAVADLMLRVPDAGISISDTLEEATQKTQQFLQEQPEAGEGLREEIVGGFRVLKDAAGNVVSTRAIETPTEEGGKTGEMSLIDIGRFQELYGVSLPLGTTWEQAREQLKPREYTDEELRQFIRIELKDNKSSFDAAISAIDSANLIANKDRAKLIASEIYEIEDRKGLFERLFQGKEEKEERGEKEERELDFKSIPPEYGQAIEKGFGDLNEQIRNFNANFLGF